MVAGTLDSEQQEIDEVQEELRGFEVRLNMEEREKKEKRGEGKRRFKVVER